MTYKKYLYNKSFNFAYINNFYNKYLGGIIPFKSVGVSKSVSNDNVILKKEAYQDGVKIIGNNTDIIKTLESGIVVFIGDKENYGQTIIIQGSDGIDYWYSNLENINVTLYDYLEKGTILGNPKNGIYYLLFAKNGEYINYEEFI